MAQRSGLGWLFALVFAGCGANGEGRVDAVFTTPECPPGTRLGELEDYGWDAGYLATDRFRESLVIQVQRYNVDILETDSVSFRLRLDTMEDAGVLVRRGSRYRLAASPTRLSLGQLQGEVKLVLGLYRTCERFPNYEALAGELELDRLDIQIDGEDTGSDEWVIGRVSGATLGVPVTGEILGEVDASFDFEPPNRPLREFE